jgi:hypothetical protein
MSKYENTIKRLAIYLHAKFCTSNHTDGCGWYYEADDEEKLNSSDGWTQGDHKRWHDKAVGVYEELSTMRIF